MAEHFRDFLHPETDAVAEKILHPTRGRLQQGLAKLGQEVLTELGGIRTSGSSDGQRWRFPYGNGGMAVMDIYEPDVVLPALLRHGDTGLFYTYTGEDRPLWTPNGELSRIPEDVDTGNPEADALVPLVTALYEKTHWVRQARWAAATVLAPLRDPIARRRWTQSTDRTKEQITMHYDASQEAYTGPNGFLDERYVQYSAGLLRPGSEFTSLEDLQEAKIDSLAKKLGLDTAETLLEIGGGWGGLAVELATRYPNLHITSLTVSDEQLDRARARAKTAEVDDRVEFLGADYRDLVAKQRFDRIVSAEMIEAVAWPDMGVYFDAINTFADSDNGAATIQAITVKQKQLADQRHNSSVLKTAIFPGGVLVSDEYIIKQMVQRGWKLHEKTALGPSYAHTIREWQRKLQANRPVLTENWRDRGISADKIERYYRGFSFYFGGCIATLRPELDHIQDWQLAFRR